MVNNVAIFDNGVMVEIKNSYGDVEVLEGVTCVTKSDHLIGVTAGDAVYFFPSPQYSIKVL